MFDRDIKFFMFIVFFFGLLLVFYIFIKFFRLLVKYWRFKGIYFVVYFDDGLDVEWSEVFFSINLNIIN